MNLFDGTSEIENYLIDKASRSNLPLGGSLELIPLCNMKCKMCYIHHSREEMEREGNILDYEQWIDIAREMKEEGVLFLLLTGGEPLIYPNFKKLYKELLKLGFVISINTNGTLIDEEMANFFAENRCRNLSITIYGCDDATYASLCGNERGYSQITNAIKLLKERNISFNLSFTPTPKNYMQFETIQKLAKDWDVKLIYTAYVFPPIRREEKEVYRLSARHVAEILFSGLKQKYMDIEEKLLAEMALDSIKPLPCADIKGLDCRGGHSGFWANWKGELMLCSMIDESRISLLEHSFRECWEYLVCAGQKYQMCRECMSCVKRSICHTCFAACYAETGYTDKVPKYLCEVTDAYIELLKSKTK